MPLVHPQAKSRRHRRGNYPTMTANKDGGTPMTISYITKSFGNPMTKTRTIEQIIEKADQALYAAKEGGRNKVRVWRNPDGEKDIGKPDKSKSRD